MADIISLDEYRAKRSKQMRVSHRIAKLMDLKQLLRNIKKQLDELKKEIKSG